MTQETPSPGNATGFPPDALERLAQFVEWTGTVAPSRLLDGDGAPSIALLAFCIHQGLSMDWLFRGDVRGLVMGSHRAASKHILNTGFEDEEEGTTWEAELVSLLLRADTRQRQIIKKAASDRLMGKPVGDVLWRMAADLDSHRTLADHPKTKGRA
jgi:hypothetical protein